MLNDKKRRGANIAMGTDTWHVLDALLVGCLLVQNLFPSPAVAMPLCKLLQLKGVQTAQGLERLCARHASALEW